ncbi:unnamed protein product, partial [marine sediment metagenome]
MVVTGTIPPPPLSNTPPIDVDKSVAVAGVATESSRQDHKHDVDTDTPGDIAVGDVAAEGVAIELARADHRHGAPAIWVPALHAATHRILGTDIVALDAIQITTGQFILTRLPRAAAGLFLEGNGVGADPIYNALVAANIPNLDAAIITSGRFPMTRMPDMALDRIMVGQGAGNSPVEEDKPIAAVGGLYGINVETLGAGKTLVPGTDEIYQYLDPDTAH